MTAAIEMTDLGKRYGKQWALRSCTLDLPAGSIAALVGPNGAGKTTLIQLAVGLTAPTTGAIRVFGDAPRPGTPASLAKIGYVAQDHPLYRRFSVADMLTMGRKLNLRWDDDLARRRLSRLNIPLDKPAGKLSGGQQAQVALVLALAKRPELVVLDEPLASLDPLARREFLQTLMDAAAEDGLSILLSSHILADLERVCDVLVILAGGMVQLAGGIDRIVASHKLLTGPRSDPAAVERVHNVVRAHDTERQTSLLVRTNGHLFDAFWQVTDVALEEIVLGYLGRPAADTPVLLMEHRAETRVEALA
jgi:ABC-2 type transport system ATP-binding protein